MSDTATDQSPAEPEITPLADGTELRYAIEDSGMDYPQLGLFLSPAASVVVGEDLDGLLAARFVGRGTLAVATSDAPSIEEKAAGTDAAKATDALKSADPGQSPAPQRVPPALLAAAEVIVAESEKAPEQA